MSNHLIKALHKAHKEALSGNPSHDESKDENHPLEHTTRGGLSKVIDFHMVFLGVLIVLVGMGVYLNYNISLNLASTQSRMLAISEQFKTQQEQLNKLNNLMLQMDAVNNGQSREFLDKIDKLSAGVEGQIAQVQTLSKSQYSELAKTIAEQQESLEELANKYTQLDKSVSNYTVVTTQYIEQLNMLKKKISLINFDGQSEYYGDKKSKELDPWVK